VKHLLLLALWGACAVMAEERPLVKSPTAQIAPSSVALPSNTRIDGFFLSEISGLAWDPEEQWLYAVSDKGYLFRLRLRIEDGVLRAVVPVAAVVLKRPAGTKGRRSGFDAEGLTLRPSVEWSGSGPDRIELLVVTEGTPRMLRVDPSGAVLGELALPAGLVDAKRYADANTMLESVAIHPDHGVLVAPERPLRGENPQHGHRIHAVDRHWNIEALDPTESHLKAMDVLEDGRLLVLERSGSGRYLVSALRSTDLDDCTGSSPCPMQTLLHIDRTGGAENFEGMAYLGNGRVLLASDNRGKKGADTVFLLVNLP